MKLALIIIGSVIVAAVGIYLVVRDIQRCLEEMGKHNYWDDED